MGSKPKPQTEKHYHASIPVLIHAAQIYALDLVLLNGEIAWEGPLLRTDSTNPVILSTEFGSIRLYWGTEAQTQDATLNLYADHPPYRGVAYAVLIDYDFGQTPQAYNIEFIYRAAPAQSIVTGASAAESLDNCLTCNPIVLAAEILTSPLWLGLGAAAINATTFQTIADEVQAEAPVGAPAGRSASALAPLWNDQAEVREVLSEVLAMADAWVRVGNDGRLECGRWRRDGDPVSVTTLTVDDLTEWPEVTLADTAERPNSFAIEFSDSEALYKEAKIAHDDQAALTDMGGTAQPLRRQTLRATYLTTYDQALRAAEEAVRRTLQRGSWSGEVRQSKAVTPGGAALQPGDYVHVPIHSPGEAVQTALLRIMKVKRARDATQPVIVEGELDPLSSAVPGTVDAAATVQQVGEIMPPIVWSRVIAVPAEESGDTPPIVALAARPHNLASGVNVHYDDDTLGDFPRVGRQGSYALPLHLEAALTAATSTVRVRLVPDDADGADAQRDVHLLTDWSGGTTEGRNDELLLLLIRKTTGVIDYQAGALLEWMEIMSVNGAASLVSAGVYDVPVLRGRQGTTALIFNDSVTFPDAWTRFEGWLIPRFAVEGMVHADFDSMLVSGDAGYFRFIAYGVHSLYDPADADAEKDRRIAASRAELEYAVQVDATTYTPAHTYTIPPGLNSTPMIDFTAPASFPAAANAGTGDLAIDVDFTDNTADLVRVQLYSQKNDGTGYQSHLDVTFAPKSTHNYTATINFPTTASTYDLCAVATDAAGNISRLDLVVTRA